MHIPVLAGGKTGSWARRGRRAPLAFAIVVACALGASSTASAATLHVAPDGEDSGNCVASPCETIQYAVDQASGGDTIAVAAGTYAEQLTIDKGVTLLGPNAGVDPNAGSRGAEAIVDGGGATAIKPEAAGIAIDGFTVAATASGFPIYTGIGDIDGLRIAHNIVGSGVRAITIETGGDGIDIEGNLIDGEGYGVILAEGAYADLQIVDNVIAGPVDAYALFNAGGSTFEGFELRGNTIHDSSNIGGSAIEGSVSDNTFDLDSPGGPALQISLHESSLSGNSFDGHGASPCLQLFGSQFGLDPSNGATVSGNDFRRCSPYGIQLSPDIDRISIARNTISDSFDGVNTRDITTWDLTGKDIRVFANRIVDSAHKGVANTVSGTLDARRNWWGCNEGPTVDGSNECDTISAGVDASPWLLLTASAEPDSMLTGQSANVTAAIDTDSDGGAAATVPDGTPVAFSTDLGSLSESQAALQSGAASTELSSDAEGVATVSAAVDDEVVDVQVEVDAPPPPPPPPLANPPVPPRLILRGDGSPLRVQGRRIGLGVLACPQGTCRIATRARKVKIGRRGYPIGLRHRKWLGAGEVSPVKAILPRKAHRALVAKRRGRAIVRLRFHSAAGVKTVGMRAGLRLRAPRERRR